MKVGFDEGFVRNTLGNSLPLHKLWFSISRLDSDPPHSESYLKVLRNDVSATRFNDCEIRQSRIFRPHTERRSAKASASAARLLRFRNADGCTLM